MLTPPARTLAKFDKRDNIAMLFLLTAFALESKCKDTKKKRTGKIILSSARKKRKNF
jgi:hypothetical protein